MVDSFDSGIVKSDQIRPQVDTPLQNFTAELYSGRLDRFAGGGYGTEIKMTEDGPQITEEHLSISDIDPDLNFLPATSLSAEEKAAIEAKPVLPDEDTITCAPLTKEQIEKFGKGPIGYKCDETPVSEWSDYQKEKYMDQHQIHLAPYDSVAKTDDGYLVFHPKKVVRRLFY